jgi:hypothetical protein
MAQVQFRGRLKNDATRLKPSKEYGNMARHHGMTKKTKKKKQRRAQKKRKRRRKKAK